MNTDDMGSYEAISEGAIKVPAGVTSSLLTSPRPSGGPALAMAASLLQGLSPLMRTPDLGLQYHLLVEVFKQSLSHRMDTSLAYSDSQVSTRGNDKVYLVRDPCKLSRAIQHAISIIVYPRNP